jgi:hypothetical protein
MVKKEQDKSFVIVYNIANIDDLNFNIVPPY